MTKKEAYFILKPKVPRHIHRSGDILLHQLGETKKWRLFFAIYGNLPNPFSTYPSTSTPRSPQALPRIAPASTSRG